MSKCNCPACLLRKALKNQLTENGINPSMIVVEISKKDENQNEDFGMPSFPLVAERDVFAGEILTFGKDVRPPTAEEMERHVIGQENLMKEIDDIWCAMMETEDRPSELDRQSYAWHHAKNLHTKGVHVGS